MLTSNKFQHICLIIEDNIPAAELMKIYLNRQGILSEIAPDGQIGLKMFLSDPLKYRIVFLDIQMPIMDGYEVAKKIRESGAANASSIPIVAISGTTTGDVLAHGNFSFFLRKPFEFRSLDAILCKFLEIDAND